MSLSGSASISRRIFTAIALAALPAAAAAASADDADPLPSWRDGAVKRAILDFLRKTTTPGSADYVPEAERVAVFDNDGTLWVEQPIYTEVAFAVSQVAALAKQHPEWASRPAFKAALSGDVAALAKGGLMAMAEIVIAANAGQTPDAVHRMVLDWLKTARHARFRRPFTACTYRPMVEVLALFRARGFRTWIFTGGTEEFVRPWAPDAYGVPVDQVVGTTLKVDYRLREGRAELVQLPHVDAINEGPQKAVALLRRLGRRPQAAFGNADGDYEMLQYTTTGGGARLGVLIHHDDGAREYAYDRDGPIGKLDRALNDAGANHWLVTSMKNDWTRIFES